MTEPLILVGRERDRTDTLSEELLDGFMCVLQEYDTATLRAIADRREEISEDGWMQRMIREYMEMWR